MICIYTIGYYDVINRNVNGTITYKNGDTYTGKEGRKPSWIFYKKEVLYNRKKTERQNFYKYCYVFV